MVNIYYLIAAIAYGIFIIQFILSWFGGDTDLDVDLDGNTDMDIGDIVSFKGFIHFLMGAFGWLSLKQYTTGVTPRDLFIAFIIGIIFIVILYYAYKLCLKLKYEPSDDNIVGRYCKIVLKHEDKYYISITINGISQEVLASPEDPNKEYNSSNVVRITKVENNLIYFK